MNAGRARVAVVAGGLFLLGGGTLAASAHAGSFSDRVQTLPYQLGAWATVIGCAVVVIGLPRFSAAVGTMASVSATAGTCLMLGLAYAEATVNPAIASVAPTLLDNSPEPSMAAGLAIAVLGFGAGWVIYGVSLLRGGAARRGPAVGVVVGAVASLAPMVPGPALVGLGLIWLGTSTGPNSRSAPEAPATRGT